MKKTYLLAAAVLTGSLALTACGQGTAPASAPNVIVQSDPTAQVITVTASEQVKVVPDVAEIVFSVYSQADTAENCRLQNNEDLIKVLDVLEAAGVADSSVQTSGYGLSPIYDWDSGRTVTGYEMTTTVTVSDEPLDQVGSLLSSCVKAGVNNIQSVSYLASNYDESYREALSKAIEAAKVKAEAIAAAGGCSIGGIKHVEEYRDNQEARYTGYENAARKEGLDAGASADMAVRPGEVSVEATVSVSFSIQ